MRSLLLRSACPSKHFCLGARKGEPRPLLLPACIPSQCAAQHAAPASACGVMRFAAPIL